MVSTSTPEPKLSLETALSGLPGLFRNRLIKAYSGLKAAFLESNFDACGLRAGRFCEVMIRLLQKELTGDYTRFGTRIGNFKAECDRLEKTPRTAGHESLRVLVPRAISFLYTLRNKRGIGHEGGDVEANEIDAATAARIADWCISELIRIYHQISLEEAQSLCDSIAARQLPQIWSVFGRKRVLAKGLDFSEQTLLLLYSDPASAVPVEDLFLWLEYSSLPKFRIRVLTSLHKARLIEYDRETEMAIIAPPGIQKVEQKLLART